MVTRRHKKSSQPLLVQLNRMLTRQTKTIRASRVTLSTSMGQSTVTIGIIWGKFHCREDELKPKMIQLIDQTMPQLLISLLLRMYFYSRETLRSVYASRLINK